MERAILLRSISSSSTCLVSTTTRLLSRSISSSARNRNRNRPNFQTQNPNLLSSVLRHRHHSLFFRPISTLSPPSHLISRRSFSSLSPQAIATDSSSSGILILIITITIFILCINLNFEILFWLLID